MATSRIPVIDVSKLNQETGDELVDAVHKWGFAFVKGCNTGFTASSIDHTFELSRTLFQSPQEEKQRCAISSNNKGWSSMHTEILDPKNQKKGDLKEAFNFGEFSHGKAQQPMPQALLAHEADIGHFAEKCRNLCMQVLRLFALGLKIDPKQGGEEWFAARHDLSKGPSGSILRLLRYPVLGACPVDTDATKDVRAGAHSDYGSITLLFQRSSQPGLELLGPQGEWSPVPVRPFGTEHDPFPPILVNVGDLLSYWTNGFLKSTVHRVVFPPGKEVGDRYSIAYFCHPANETRLTAVPSEVIGISHSEQVQQEGSTSSSILTAEEHLRSRLAATYGWDK